MARMGRAVMGVLPWLALAACSSEGFLALPEVEGAVAGVVVVSSGGAVRAEVISPAEALRVGADDGLVEALAFTAPLGVESGPLDSPSDGRALPPAAASFRADLGGLTWTSAAPSSAVASVRLPALGDDCPRYTSHTDQLSDTEPAGVVAMERAEGDDRLVITPGSWFLVTASDTRPVTPLVRGAQAVARDPGGGFWIAAGSELWAVSGPTLATATATLARALPHGLAPFALAAPQPGVVYGLDAEGRFFRSDTATTTVLHRFTGGPSGTRGMVVRDGEGVLAGLGSDPTFIRVENSDVRTTTLPSPGEGVVSIARFAEYGVVVGTNQGILRSERLSFDPVPDPLRQMPRGVQIRVLKVSGDHLWFGGNSGMFGEITPRRFVCQSTTFATSGVRFLEGMGDQILAAGIPLDITAGEANLTRFTREP